jgi:type I restriction enzyme S subunit
MTPTWTSTPLAAALQPVTRTVRVDALAEYNLLGIRLDSGGPFLREKKLGSEISATTLAEVKPGDFIYSRLFAWRGAFGIIPPDLDGCFVSNEFPTFVPRDGVIDVGFLNYWLRLRGTLRRVEVDCSGSTPLTRNRYKEEFFLRLEIPLPPLSEQRRIVAKIQQLASKIEEARGLGGKSGAEGDALFATTCRELFLSSGWPLATVEEIVGQQNLRNGKSVKVGDHPDGIRCLRLSAMRDGRLDYDESKIVPLTAVEAQEYLIQAGDVFVMRGNGSKDLVGRAALAKESPSRTIFPDLLIRIPLGGTPWSPDFFVAYWNCPVMRRTILDAAKTTSGIWKINQGHIASFHVPLPPVPEQRRIVAYLDDLQAKVDQLKTLQAQTAAELDALLPSILDRAFRGEL